MTGKLAAQLGDLAIAATMTTHLVDVCLTWTSPAVSVEKIDRIVAYAFGNRPNATNSGSAEAPPLPGPINEALADVVYALYGRKQVRIYAQWEIARVLVAKHRLKDVVSIEPVMSPDGSVTYLSTDGVAAAVVEHEGGNAAAMGRVAVVAHHDHAKRCVQMSRGRGMDAYVADGVKLPDTYDPQSGQAWTRRRDLYLIHDLYVQFATLRSALLEGA